MNSATSTPTNYPTRSDPRRVQRPTRPEPAAAGDRHDERIASFFRDKVPPGEADRLRRRVWERASGELRTLLLRFARDALLEYYEQFGYPRTCPAPVYVHGLRAIAAPGRRLRSALSETPLDERILLDLRYREQMSSGELSALYRLPVATIREMLRRVRRDLDVRLAALSRVASSPHLSSGRAP